MNLAHQLSVAIRSKGLQWVMDTDYLAKHHRGTCENGDASFIFFDDFSMLIINGMNLSVVDEESLMNIIAGEYPFKDCVSIREAGIN